MEIQVKEALIQQQAPVYRVTYLCHGYNEWQIAEKSTIDGDKEKKPMLDSIPTKWYEKASKKGFGYTPVYHKCQNDTHSLSKSQNSKIKAGSAGRKRRRCLVQVHVEVIKYYFYFVIVMYIVLFSY